MVQWKCIAQLWMLQRVAGYSTASKYTWKAARGENTCNVTFAIEIYETIATEMY